MADRTIAEIEAECDVAEANVKRLRKSLREAHRRVEAARVVLGDLNYELMQARLREAYAAQEGVKA